MILTLICFSFRPHKKPVCFFSPQHAGQCTFLIHTPPRPPPNWSSQLNSNSSLRIMVSGHRSFENTLPLHPLHFGQTRWRWWKDLMALQADNSLNILIFGIIFKAKESDAVRIQFYKKHVGIFIFNLWIWLLNRDASFCSEKVSLQKHLWSWDWAPRIWSVCHQNLILYEVSFTFI